MKSAIFLSMSLLSLLFGCGGKKKSESPPLPPRFPESDNPAATITPVALDEGLGATAFWIAPDHRHVYVLAYRDTVRRRDSFEVASADALVFLLDSQGLTRARLDVPDSRRTGGGAFGWMDDRLWVRLHNCFLAVDTAKFAFGEKIPVYDTHFFPTTEDIEMMTFDEQRDNYERAFNAMLAGKTNRRWLDWTAGGEYFVLAEDANGRRAAWSPGSYADEEIEPMKARFEPFRPLLNPLFNEGTTSGEFRIQDGPAQIREVEIRSAGTELDYPNYKNRLTVQYEMTLGEQKIRFYTTDKKRHNLFLGFADNRLLTTADGAAWVKYEGVLYRVE